MKKRNGGNLIKAISPPTADVLKTNTFFSHYTTIRDNSCKLVYPELN